MKRWHQYVRAQSIADAVAALGESASVIAGGTDLLLDLDQGRHPPVETLVDVSEIAELRRLQAEGDRFFIGAAVPLKEIIQHGEVQRQFAALTHACDLIGGPQVRNVATLGGNVAHALPAGDGTIALLALGAEAQIASADGNRWTDLENLFAGPGRPTFDRSSELLVGFRIPMLQVGECSAFQRVMRPQGVAIAIMNMSVRLRLESERSIRAIRLAVGPAGPTPLRARSTEQFLTGRELKPAALAEASHVLADEVKLRTSPHRATQAYRQHLLQILLERTLASATSEVLDV